MTIVLDRIIHHWAEQPERTAIVDANVSMSYGELDRRSDALAARLVDAGVVGGDTVGVYLTRSAAAIVSMVACWRAGAAFLPLEPAWDDERLGEQTRAAGITALITGTAADVVDTSVPRIHPDCVPALDAPSGALSAMSGPDGAATAYVIFTSGSTGRPKGVPITHANLANYAQWFSELAGLDSTARAGVLTSMAFDLAYTSVWPTLYAGGAVHVAPDILEGGAQPVVDFLADHNTRLIKATPSLLGLLLPAWTEKSPTSLETVVTGGEFPRLDDLRRLHTLVPGLTAINHYGPTEATIGCAAHVITAKDLEGDSLPVGVPASNMVAFLLDDDDRPVHDGLVGSLCVSGASVSPGYLDGGPERSEAFFVARELSDGPVYRTGDLAYRDEHGRLVLVGRNDRQVKVSGHRIELDDVELRLAKLDGVTDSAAITVENDLGDVELVGFVSVADSTAVWDRGLTAALPGPLRPTTVHVVADWPVTANAKVDRAALLARHDDARAREPRAERDGPRTATEQELLDVWVGEGFSSDVLLDETLVSQGASSIQILRFYARFRDRFGESVTLPEVFASSIRSLAERVDLTVDGDEPTDAGISFSSSARRLRGLAYAQRLSIAQMTVALVANAAYLAQDDDVETVRLVAVTEDDSAHALALDFASFDGLDDLARAVADQWDPVTADALPPASLHVIFGTASTTLVPHAAETAIAVQVTENTINVRCSSPGADDDTAHGVTAALRSTMENL